MEVFIMQTQFNYGHIVCFYPVIDAEKRMEVFIPDLYPWEEGAEETIVFLNDKYSIDANKKSKLLFYEDHKSMREIDLHFESGYSDKPVAFLQKTLAEEGIIFEPGNGRGCDGIKWCQEDYTSEVMYCEDAMMDRCTGPYWGEQYQFDFLNESCRPVLGGQAVRSIRFSDCVSGVWSELEKWFTKLLDEPRAIDRHELSVMARELTEGGPFDLSVFKKIGCEYDWIHLDI